MVKSEVFNQYLYILYFMKPSFDLIIKIVFIMKS